MKDNDITQVFDQYKAEVTPPKSLKKAQPKQSPRRFLKPAFVTAAVATIVTATLLYPQNSKVDAYTAMQEAITDASSMRLKMYSNSYGQEVLMMTIENSGDAWRYEVLGHPFKRMHIHQGDRFLEWYKQLPYAVTGTWPPDQNPEAKSALEYFQELTLGEKAKKGTFRPINFPNTPSHIKVLYGERPETEYQCWIWVDRKTNLPQKAKVVHKTERSPRTERFTFEWNIPIANSRFNEESLPVPVRNADQERREFFAQWQKPIQSFSKPDGTYALRDVTVNPEGVVYVISTASPVAKDTFYMPTHLTDESGLKYVRLPVYTQNGFVVTNYLLDKTMFGKEEMHLARFIPVHPVQPTGKLRLTIDRSTYVYGQEDDLNRPFEPGVITYQVEPKRTPSEYMPYSTALHLEKQNILYAKAIAAQGSKAAIAVGEFDSALIYGWKAYEKSKRVVPRIAYMQIPLVIAALEAKGDLQEADRVRQMYVEGERNDPYIHSPNAKKSPP